MSADEEHELPRATVPARLARRGVGRDWPIEDVIGGFAATRAQNFLAAHTFTLGHLVLELTSLPGVNKLLAKHSRLRLVAVSASEYAVMPLPEITSTTSSRSEVGPLSDLVLGHRGLVSGSVMVAGKRHLVPRRQHSDLKAFLTARKS